jgi:hypothetical protein
LFDRRASAAALDHRLANRLELQRSEPSREHGSALINKRAQRSSDAGDFGRFPAAIEVVRLRVSEVAERQLVNRQRRSIDRLATRPILNESVVARPGIARIDRAKVEVLPVDSDAGLPAGVVAKVRGLLARSRHCGTSFVVRTVVKTTLLCRAAEWQVIAIRESAIGCKSRGDRRWTFPNDYTGVRLFHAAIAVARPFTAEELEALGRGQAV